MMKRTRVNNKSREVELQIKAATNRSAEAMGRTVVGQVRRILLRGTRSGRTGQVPETGVPYTMSAPGEAPAPRTGQLANSYNFYLIGNKRVRVGSDVPQARLEFGIGNIAPRPHLRPALEQSRHTLMRIARGEFSK